MHWGQVTSVVFLAKIHNLSLTLRNDRKTKKTNAGRVYKINSPQVKCRSCGHVSLKKKKRKENIWATNNSGAQREILKMIHQVSHASPACPHRWERAGSPTATAVLPLKGLWGRRPGTVLASQGPSLGRWRWNHLFKWECGALSPDNHSRPVSENPMCTWNVYIHKQMHTRCGNPGPV